MKILNENKKEVIVKQDNYLTELKNTQELCSLLMKTPHYAKMGQEGIFAIVETAKSLGVDPRQALGGGLYFVRGKVEMSARMMNALIRSRKHSITRDKRSNDTICILHGKRSDNGDGWSESFSLEEAKKAGLYRENGPWKTFTRDMLFARALSRLARQLFPDIVGNCYVEGEISLDPNIKEEITDRVDVNLTEEQAETLEIALDLVPEYKQTIMEFLRKKDINNIFEIPLEMYSKILKKAEEMAQETKEVVQEKEAI